MHQIYQLVELSEVIEKLNADEPVFFDTETIGKYGKIRLAQFYQEDWPQVLMVEYPSPMELFLLFSGKLKDTNLVMQYASYDISTVQNQLGTRFIPNKFSDTFLLARLAFPHLQEYSLDALITYVDDGQDPYAMAGISKKDMHKANWKAIKLDPKQLLYAAIDVYHLPKLYNHVKIQETSLSYTLDMHTLRHALDFQNNGLPVDINRVEHRYANNLAKLEELDMPINVNSYKQVRPYIGSDDSDDLGLARLSMAGNERAAAVRQARKLLKENSFLNKYNTDTGMIYGHFVPSARSGRCTCSDQNLQQLPRVHKNCFGYSPNGDSCLLYADYSQLELRSITAITAEPKLIELYSEDKDVHDYVAIMLFGQDFTSEQRRIAKTCNFNLLYGGGARMFQSILIKDAGVYLELEECTRIKRKWQKLFPTIASWQQKGIRDFHRGSLGSTPFGRKYRGNLMTDQLNIENQGFGAEVSKLALHYMKPKLDELGCQINNFVHDSYIVTSANEEAVFSEAAKVIGNSMKEAWLEASKMAKVKSLPMPVKVQVGWNWGDIEDGDYFHEFKVKA